MLAGFLDSQAQTQIAGFVRDSLTRQPIAHASVALMGTTEGVTSNAQGGFQVNSQTSVAVLQVTALGYQPKNIALRQNQAVLVVDLVPQSRELDEVVVKRTKNKYSKRDNPAVALAKRLMVLKDHGKPTDQPYYSHQRYERMMYGFNDFDQVKDKNLLFRKFGFLGDYADTSAVTGKRVLPISIKEQFSEEYYRRSPRTHKELIVGQKSTGRLLLDWAAVIALVVSFAIFGRASPAAFAVSSSASTAMLRTSRGLPLTCTEISTVASIVLASSYSGHGASEMKPSCPRYSQISSQRCGANGVSSFTNVRY